MSVLPVYVKLAVVYIVPFPFDINTRFKPSGDIDGPILEAVVALIAQLDVPCSEPVNTPLNEPLNEPVLLKNVSTRCAVSIVEGVTGVTGVVPALYVINVILMLLP